MLNCECKYTKNSNSTKTSLQVSYFFAKIINFTLAEEQFIVFCTHFLVLASKKQPKQRTTTMPLKDIALTFVPQLGLRGAAHLIRHFGSAEAVYAASRDELIEGAELREAAVKSILAGEGLREAEREMEYCRRNGITPVAASSPHYPRLLRETDDFPAVLYVCGNINALNSRMVSFVGTRKMSSYGQHMCDTLVRELVEAVPDVTIVSGLAYGVDGACHRAALAYGAKTVAVLANTLPKMQPAAHERMAAEMISRGGAVVSELNSQTKQNGQYFIPRNRIIAGMTAGTVVVESPEAGGSLSTAAFADGYNRTVMAVPGRVTDSNSRGCNLLIRNRKAQAVLSGSDIARELMWDLELDSIEEPQREALPLTDDERRLFDLFDTEPITIDLLQQRSGLSMGELSLTLMNLELSGAIRLLPGKRYEKII